MIEAAWHALDTPFGVVVLMMIGAFLLPCRFDPAIRIKQWQIKQGWHPESPRRGDDD